MQKICKMTIKTTLFILLLTTFLSYKGQTTSNAKSLLSGATISYSTFHSNKENLTLEQENFQTLTAKNVDYQQETIELKDQIKNFFSGSASSRIKKNTSIYKVH